MTSLAQIVRRSAALAIVLLSWQQATYAQACNQPGRMAQVYAAEAASHPADDGFGIGRRVHSVTFTSSQTMKVCSIGYEAPPNPPATYEFRLYDCTSGTSIPIPGASTTVPGTAFVGGLHYVPVHWGIVAGRCYEVRRKVNATASAAQRQGRRLANEAAYPITSAPPITVLSTSFFNSGSGSPIVDQDLPFIDLGWY